MQPNPVNDYGTGYMGAYAVALALLHRQRTGQGQHVDTALAYTAMTLQSPYMQRYEGKEWDEARGVRRRWGAVRCTGCTKPAIHGCSWGRRRRICRGWGRYWGCRGLRGCRMRRLEQALEERFSGGYGGSLGGEVDGGWRWGRSGWLRMCGS